MAKDVVCGMNVADDSQLKSSHAGKTYLFCSAGCKAKFDKEPASYVAKAGATGQPAAKKSCC